MITQDRLKQLLFYDSKTGYFTWLVPKGSRVKKGDRAGNTHKTLLYVYLKIDQKVYLAHRLAWLYMTGIWPDKEIDHENKQKWDNRWDNLREATHAENGINKIVKERELPRGVRHSKTPGKYHANIGGNKNGRYLGTFNSIESAKEAYLVEATKTGFYPKELI